MPQAIPLTQALGGHMPDMNMIHIEILYTQENGEEYIFTCGRGRLRLNQETAKWLHSWLGRHLTPRAADLAVTPPNEPTQADE